MNAYFVLKAPTFPQGTYVYSFYSHASISECSFAKNTGPHAVPLIENVYVIGFF